MSAGSQLPTGGFRRPGRALTWTEYSRSMGDLAAFWSAFPSLAAGSDGDGHAVLVLPGFLADDRSTVGLRTVLTARGYDAAMWRLGTNLGPTQRICEGMISRLRYLHKVSGGPVSLVGWSLGGILARELARHHPQLCRQVISLGSPFRLPPDPDPGTTTVGEIFHALKPLHTDLFTGAPRGQNDDPLPVPATAIYTRLDGVVPWRACLEPASPTSESIEVTASHCGLGFHPPTMRIILDRLAQPLGSWQPYRPRRLATVA